MIEKIICRTIGCTSLWARWFAWPHSICTWYVARFYVNEEDS